MQSWNSREIQAAILQDISDDRSIDKLRSLLINVKNSFPAEINDQVLSTLCRIDKLSIDNPTYVESVWVAVGNFRQTAAFAARTIEVAGHSPADAIVGLINKIAVLQALSAFKTSDATASPGHTSYPSLHRYAQSLLAKLLVPESASKQIWRVRNLANRIDSVFPKALYLHAIPGALPDITEGCAASTRQRDAIALALCEKIEIHAYTLWRYRQLPPRNLSFELKTIFDYYCKRCFQTNVQSSEFLLDLSLDWGPSVYVAISSYNDNSYVVAGTGCGISAHAGIARAVLDLRRREYFVQQILQRKQVHGLMSLDSREQEILHLMQTNDQPHKHLTEPARDSIKEKFWPEGTFVRRVARQAASVGIDLFYSDITTSASPLSVVKVLSPQLLTSATTN